MNERISLSDNAMDVVMKMSDGNPGAINVLTQLLKSDNIDPDNPMGGVGTILMLDTIGIYGTDIYILYNDICESNLPKMIAVVRAVQLGLFDGETLKNAAHRQDRSGVDLVPVDDLYEKVQEKLPNFNVTES